MWKQTISYDAVISIWELSAGKSATSIFSGYHVFFDAELMQFILFNLKFSVSVKRLRSSSIPPRYANIIIEQPFLIYECTESCNFKLSSTL